MLSTYTQPQRHLNSHYPTVPQSPESASIQVAGKLLMDQTLEMLLSGQVKTAMDHIILGMRVLKQRYSIQEWQAFSKTTFLQHPVTQLIHQCPFTRHAFVKPRGYAGDAELLDYIYGIKQPPQDLSALGREIFHYCRNAEMPKSVRARRTILAQTIDGVAAQSSQPIRALAIACGHLREVQDSVAIQTNQVAQLIAFDQDPLSLELINQALPSHVIQTIQGSVTTLVRQRTTFEKLDLVYAAGLYDYLSQPFATRLTKVMFDMLRPGGTLLVANFVPNHREVGYMETFMQWRLIYRTAEMLVEVTQEISPTEIINQQLFCKDHGNIVFLKLVKA